MSSNVHLIFGLNRTLDASLSFESSIRVTGPPFGHASGGDLWTPLDRKRCSFPEYSVCQYDLVSAVYS
ncbi:hypothetical protein SRM_p61007 (plasmid) [Salinibacter ruber M8]|uniref:Uncharacterized protein n=1 Tax=Salinibacter ruber (strain M8) TaxID=761659 RepID=D5H4C3_SALRM|nr:hypothetical protein SRM_p61007 [Salinibacter ruber M8]